LLFLIFFSSSPGDPYATVVHAEHVQIRKNSFHSPVYLSNVFGFQLYWHCGILVRGSIPDVLHCEGQVKTISCNDGIFSFLLAPLTLCLLGSMVEEKGSFVNSDKERGETKRRKLKKNIL
jgi:hypothetical protein